MQIQLQVGGVTDGDTSPGPCQAVRHAEELAERPSIAGHAQSTNVEDVDANEVDEPVADQRQHTAWLTNSSPIAADRRLLAQDTEVSLSSEAKTSSRRKLELLHSLAS